MGTQSSKPRRTTIEQDEFTGSIQVSEGVARRLFQPRLQTNLAEQNKDVVSKSQATTKKTVESSPKIIKDVEAVKSLPIHRENEAYTGEKKALQERTSDTPVRDTVLTKPEVYDGLKEADVDKLVQSHLSTERKTFEESLQNERSHYEKLMSNLLKEEDVEKYVQTELHKERDTFQEDLKKQKSYYENLLSDLQTQYNNNFNNLRNQFDDNLNQKLSKIPEPKATSLENDVHYHLKITTDKLKEKEALLEHVSNEKNILYQDQKRFLEEMSADMQKAINENASKVEAEKIVDIRRLKEIQEKEIYEFKETLNNSFHEKEIALEVREQEKEEALKNLITQKEELLSEMIQQKETELNQKEIDRQMAWEKVEEDHREIICTKEKEREEAWNNFFKQQETLMNEKELEREALFSKKEIENEDIRQKKVQLIKSELQSKLDDYKEKLQVADLQNKSLFESSEEALKQSLEETQTKFPMPLKSSICSDDALEVLSCLQTNVKKPLLCSATVKAFSLCVQSHRTSSVKL